MSRSQATEDTEPAAYFMRSPLRTLNALAFKLFINIKTLFLLISVVQKNKKIMSIYITWCIWKYRFSFNMSMSSGKLS